MNPYVIPGILMPKGTHTMDSIIEAICDHYKITKSRMIGKSRKRELVIARHLFFYFSRTILRKTLFDIGLFAGGRDHTTVLHGCQTISDLIKTDDKVVMPSMQRIQIKLGLPVISRPDPTKETKPIIPLAFERSIW
jgi:chromosomal replication initiation ATPase DnaA